jgi:hypothetical protein
MFCKRICVRQALNRERLSSAFSNRQLCNYCRSVFAGLDSQSSAELVQAFLHTSETYPHPQVKYRDPCITLMALSELTQRGVREGRRIPSP